MKVLIILFIGTTLLVLTQAAPESDEPFDDNEIGILQPEIPAYLTTKEGDLLSHQGKDTVPHSRQKRSKKRVIVINQYYSGQPPANGYGNGGYGGYPGGYPGYGGYNSPYGYSDPYYYDDDRDGGGRRRGRMGKIFKKLKKFG